MVAGPLPARYLHRVEWRWLAVALTMIRMLMSAACQGREDVTMSETMELWENLRTADTRSDERAAVDRFRAHMGESDRTVAIYLTNTDGEDVSMDRWHLQEGPLRVHLELDGETRGEAWTPLHRDNLALLLLE